MIPVTKPFLPPKEEYEALINDVWQRNWLTNNGPLVNELELKLKDFLGLKHTLFLTNGTIALQIAIKALDLKGEIITTPFSYIATTSSIAWEGCTPVFVDIDPETLNIDPSKIKGAITSKTSAILATHVFGNPCDVNTIKKIAKEYNLKVIYDAAHSFGVSYKNKSIFEYGDISTTSFHATKLFHTIEGGAVFTDSPGILKRMAYMRNFGHDGPEKFAELGINGKNSEFHAAMGLVNLKYIDQILETRRDLYLYYHRRLKNLECTHQTIASDTNYNYSYYPIILPSESVTKKIIEELNINWIYPRRYFYPLLSTLPYVNPKKLPIATGIASRILSLPLYHTLTYEEIDLVARLILRIQNN